MLWGSSVAKRSSILLQVTSSAYSLTPERWRILGESWDSFLRIPSLKPMGEVLKDVPTSTTEDPGSFRDLAGARLFDLAEVPGVVVVVEEEEEEDFQLLFAPLELEEGREGVDATKSGVKNRRSTSA